MKHSHHIYFLLVIAFFTLQQCDNNDVITCSSYDTDEFIGSYNVIETCTQGPNHGVTFGTITEGNSTALNEVMFLNFNNTGSNVVAYLGCTESSDSSDDFSIYFRIPSQTLGSTASSVVGEGYLTRIGTYTQLDFSVQLNEYGTASYCTYTYSK